MQELKEFDYRAYLLQKGYGDRDLVAGKGTNVEIPLFRICPDADGPIEYVVREVAEHAKPMRADSGTRSSP